jgi:hypothetical protein
MNVGQMIEALTWDKQVKRRATMRVKTSEAKDKVLDYLVAKAEGLEVWQEPDGIYLREGGEVGFMFRPSTYWAQGGPIIEREEIGIKRNSPCSDGRQWEASPSITAKGAGGKWGYGPTPLVAAMRCYVASKLGDEVEIPEEVTK